MFRARRGVCQDLAHVEIACLRALGLSARHLTSSTVGLVPGIERLTGEPIQRIGLSATPPTLTLVFVALEREMSIRLD